MISPQNALASQTINTDTNTKTYFSKIKDFFSSQTAKADENVVTVSEQIAPEPEPVKTEEELKNEAILNKWKIKQEDKWKNLPKDPFRINASAYTAAADECGGNTTGKTASGIIVKAKRTIACPPAFPFGAKLEIEGYGTYVCEDRGGAIKGNHIDIYVETKAEAFAFGRQNLNARFIE